MKHLTFGTPTILPAAASDVVSGRGKRGPAVDHAQPACSVIIPSFNSAKFIDVALFSLQSQTRKPDEVIIVDAGSADGTRELVDSFRNALNILFIDAPRTSMGVARNIGIRAARSDTICFLDSDDIFLRNHVERACALLAADPAIDAVHGYPVQWNSFTDRLETAYDWLHEIDHQLEIFECSLINLSTLTVRRDFLTRNGLMFSEGLQGRYCEDWDFCLRLIAAGMRITYLQEPVSVVTERAGSHTRKSIFWKMRFAMFLSLAKYRDARVFQFLDDGSKKRISTAIDFQRFKSVLTLLTANRPKTAYRVSRGLESCKFRSMALVSIAVARILPNAHNWATWLGTRIGGYGHWRPRAAVALPPEPALNYLRERLGPHRNAHAQQQNVRAS